MKRITSYIGQVPTVGNINEMITAYDNEKKKGHTYAWRPINLEGWTGTGKSNLARALSDCLEEMGFNYYEVPQNAGWNDLYKMFGKISAVDYDKGTVSAIPTVIFWDEFHSQKSGLDIMKALTTKVEEEHTITRQGHTFHYDPTNHIHIFASNFSLDKAMKRRCRNFLLTQYSPTEMRELVEIMICKRHGVKMDDKAIESLLERTKPLAGDLEEVGAPIVNRCKARGDFKMSAADVTDVLKKQGFFPRGLRRSDMAIMNQLAKNGVSTANVLKYEVQDEKKKDTQEKIDWLCSLKLVEPVRGGFKLAKKGGEYMADIIAKQKAAAKAKK